MSETKTCNNSACDKKFSITEMGINAPGGSEREDITCPYCGNTTTRRSRGVFVTRPLPEEDQ